MVYGAEQDASLAQGMEVMDGYMWIYIYFKVKYLKTQSSF